MIKKMYIFQRILFSCLSFCAFSVAEGVESKTKLSIDFLSDETPASCGCFAWFDSKTQKSGKLIFQELETNDRKYLNMKINGEILDLTKKDLSDLNKFHISKVGSIVNEKYNSADIEIDAKWKAKKITRSDEESARNVTFIVDFLVKNKAAKKKIRAAGYCGC